MSRRHPTRYPIRLLLRRRDAIRAEARQDIIDAINANPGAYLLVTHEAWMSGATFDGPLIVLGDNAVIERCQITRRSELDGLVRRADLADLLDRSADAVDRLEELEPTPGRVEDVLALRRLASRLRPFHVAQGTL